MFSIDQSNELSVLEGDDGSVSQQNGDNELTIQLIMIMCKGTGVYPIKNLYKSII